MLASSRPTLIKHNKVLMKGMTINQYWVSFVHCHFFHISYICKVCVDDTKPATIMKAILEPLLTILQNH